MEEILLVAYRRCRANRGAPGCDGQSFEQIEKQGRDQWLERLRQELSGEAVSTQAPVTCLDTQSKW
jgi:hypothetical protein